MFAYKIGNFYLLLQECDSRWDYSILDESRVLVDGGQIDDPQLSAAEVVSEIRSVFCELFPKALPAVEIKYEED